MDMKPLKDIVRVVVPPEILSAYHFTLSYIASLAYGNPSKRLIVVGVTGTKGKSSTIEFANAIFEAAGWKTALTSSIRLKIAGDSKPNTMRMTMAGRFFLQRFFDLASRNGCRIAFVEMTSEGARQFRHRFIELDALIFTNLAPEHIESHGSLQAYAEAKLEIGKQLARSEKRPRLMIANADDKQSVHFLALPVDKPLPFSLRNAAPYSSDEHGGSFRFEGRDITIQQPGEFSLMNALAAATLARAMDISLDAIAQGLASVAKIPGRAERIDEGQAFPVIVDYAHTPESLKAIYTAYGKHHRICVLGSTGGGRDTWKRPVMGGIADAMCDSVIVTNEDPYDEDPRGIADALASGMKRKPEIIMDRRLAIRRALEIARSDSAILITGKGTDPCICGPRGTKTPWSDAQVAREELKRLHESRPRGANAVS